MPQWWQSARWRSWLMQGSLWAILAGTLALAAVVSRWRVASLRVELAASQSIPTLSLRVQVPRGWSGPQHADHAVSFHEPKEPDGTPGRILQLARERAPGIIDPIEHLLLTERLGALRPAELDAVAASARPTRIGGWPGLIILHQALVRGRGVEPILIHQAIASAILPSDEAIVITLEGAGPADPSDRDLLQRIAESVQFDDLPPPADATQQSLPGGIAVPLPAHLLAAKADPLRTSLRLYGDESWGGWLAIELAPAIFAPDDPPANLAAILAARDGTAHWGPVRRLDANTFLCQRTGVEARHFPADVYLLAQGDGQALLAEFRGDGRTSYRFEAIWREIAPATRFPEPPPFASMLQRGREFAAGLPALLADLRDTEQKWQWYDESPAADVGSTDLALKRQAGALVGRMLTRHSNGDDAQAEQIWSASADAKAYRSRHSRQRLVHDELRLAATLDTTLAASKLRFSSGGNSLELPAPPEYVPGALLPLVLGRTPPGRLIVRTDSFFTTDMPAFAGTLAVIVEPCPDAPERLDPSGQPMRCLSLSLSGSGQSSRWYFDSDGNASYIDLAGRLHALRQGPGPTSLPTTRAVEEAE